VVHELATAVPLQFCCVRRGFWWLLVMHCRVSQAGRSGLSAR
jgi:hypothetical protein